MKPLLSRRQIPYNPYFIFPFLLWIIAGGILLATYSQQQLFFAANTHYSTIANTLFYYITWLGEGNVIVCVLALLLAVRRLRTWWYFATALLCNIIPLLIQQSFKSYFNAPRPRLLYHDAKWMHYLPDWPLLLHNSFPSGHSQGAFSFFCFLSLLLPARYARLGFIFFLLAISVCYSRMYLAAHFFADIYAGSSIGGVTTMIIYTIMYQYKDRFIVKRKSAE